MTSPLSPIGLFDSGVGGLTIMKELSLLLPKENLVYLGDTAHLPYGEKKPKDIIRYTLENSKSLLKQNIKLLIIACHTASIHALKTVQQNLSIPVFGVVDAAIQQLSSIEENAHLAILGTTRTIQSGVYPPLIQKFYPRMKTYPIACPLFVPLIEEKKIDEEAIFLIANHYLSPLKNKPMNAALLACTHYPHIQNILQKILGPKISLLEPGKTVAAQTLEYLKKSHLLNQQNTTPSYQFHNTAPSEQFYHFVQGSFNINHKKD